MGVSCRDPSATADGTDSISPDARSLRWAFHRLQLSEALAFARALHFEGEPVFLPVGVDHDMIAVQHFAVENLHGQRILHQPLDCALQRTRAIHAVISFPEDQLLRGGGYFDRDSAVG